MIRRRSMRIGVAAAMALATAGWARAIAAAPDTGASVRVPPFARYAVAGIYRGPVRLPDFRGRDHAFSEFRTNIRDGMSSGANFAGHYAIVGWGCGTECISYVVGDVATGKVYNFPLGGEDYRQLSLNFRPASRLIVAEWLSDADGSSSDHPVENCFRQNFVWSGSAAVPLSKPDRIATTRSGSLEQCDRP